MWTLRACLNVVLMERKQDFAVLDILRHGASLSCGPWEQGPAALERRFCSPKE